MGTTYLLMEAGQALWICEKKRRSWEIFYAAILVSVYLLCQGEETRSVMSYFVCQIRLQPISRCQETDILNLLHTSSTLCELLFKKKVTNRNAFHGIK